MGLAPTNRAKPLRTGLVPSRGCGGECCYLLEDCDTQAQDIYELTPKCDLTIGQVFRDVTGQCWTVIAEEDCDTPVTCCYCLGDSGPVNIQVGLASYDRTNTGTGGNIFNLPSAQYALTFDSVGDLSLKTGLGSGSYCLWTGPATFSCGDIAWHPAFMIYKLDNGQCRTAAMWLRKVNDTPFQQVPNLIWGPLGTAIDCASELSFSGTSAGFTQTASGNASDCDSASQVTDVLGTSLVTADAM